MKDREDQAKGFSFPLCLFCLLQKDFAELYRSNKMAEEEQATETTEKEEKQAPEFPNTVTIEDAGPSKKKILIEIPAEAIKHTIDEQYEELRKEAVLPGFRKGRAPRRLLERRFGKETTEQIKLKLLADASKSALEDSELQTLGDPNIDFENIELPAEGPMKFEFDVEVRPEFKLPKLSNTLSPDQVPFMVAKAKPARQFIDMLGVCAFRVGHNFTRLINLVNAVTGWTLTFDDAIAAAEREVNLMRAFNIRHGVSVAVEAPSILYSSVPVDGPAKGKDVKPHWNHMLDEYYKHMGWDRKSGRPLVETLKKLELEAEARDLWGNP